MRFLKALLCVLMPIAAQADEDWGPDYAQIPLASYHFGTWEDRDFNEINPGLLLTWAERAGELDYTFGAYKDSVSSTTVHASIAKTWSTGKHTNFGLVGAYIHSASEDGYRGFVPSMQFTYRRVFLNLAAGYDDGVYGVLGGGLTVPLKRP